MARRFGRMAHIVFVGDLMRKDVCEPLPKHLISELFDSMNEGLHAYGYELEFVERNDFSNELVGWLYARFENSIREWIGDPSYSVFNNEDLKRECSDNCKIFSKCVAVQLRNYFRKKFNKAELSELEIANFRLGMPDKFDGNEFGIFTGGEWRKYTPTNDEIKSAAQYMIKKFPEVVRYIKLVWKNSETQGYIGDRSVGGVFIPQFFSRASLLAVVANMRDFFEFNRINEVAKLAIEMLD